jgi:hypothetical protein
MKRKTKMTMTDAERERHLHRLCEELGEDTIQKLHKAYELTAGALYKQAKRRAEAELRKDEK